jgi:hypothetical protein
VPRPLIGASDVLVSNEGVRSPYTSRHHVEADEHAPDGMLPVIAGGATLVFDIELLGTKQLDAAPEVSAPRSVPPQ